MKWPAGDPQRVIRGVLADPRFAQPVPAEPAPSWWELIGRWLGELVHAIFSRVDRALGGRSSLLEWAVFAVLACVALVALRALALRLRRSTGVGRGVRRERPPAVGTAAPPAAADLRRRAREAAARGRPRAAARLYFEAAVRALDERGRVPFDAARTPGDVRRLADDPRIDDFVRQAVPAIYAAQPPREDDLRRLDAAYGACFD